jgi:hypothetical protein
VGGGVALSIVIVAVSVEPSQVKWRASRRLPARSSHGAAGSACRSKPPVSRARSRATGRPRASARLNAGVLLPLVLLVIAGVDGEARSVLARPPLLMLGRASYATYILHVPVFFVLLRFDPEGWHKPSFLAAYAFVMLVVSLVAHHAIEEPARRAITRRALARPEGMPLPDAR